MSLHHQHQSIWPAAGDYDYGKATTDFIWCPPNSSARFAPSAIHVTDEFSPFNSSFPGVGLLELSKHRSDTSEGPLSSLNNAELVCALDPLLISTLEAALVENSPVKLGMVQSHKQSTPEKDVAMTKTKEPMYIGLQGFPAQTRQVWKAHAGCRVPERDPEPSTIQKNGGRNQVTEPVESKALWGNMLLVIKFPKTSKAQELKASFERFGIVTTTKILRDHQGASKCAGFVHFKTAEAAQHALHACQMGRVILDDQNGKAWHVKAEYARSWPQKHVRPRRSAHSWSGNSFE